MTDGVARSLAQIYSTALLLARIDLFEALLKSGQLTPRKSAAAALVHLIKNPDGYVTTTLVLTPPASGSRPRKVPAPAEVTEPSGPTLAERVAVMTPQERGDHLVSQLKLLCSSRLSLLELDALRNRAVTGELDAAEVIGEALRATAEGRMDTFLKCMRQSFAQELFPT